MEDNKVRCCRLCRTIIKDENYEVIEDVTKETLNVLLLKLDLDDYSQHVMCNVCSPKLQAALKFRSTWFYTNNTINSYVDDRTVLSIDLREIYIKERKNSHIPDDVKICCVCLHQIENISGLKSINEEQADMIQKFIPEVNIFIIKDPVMCKLCQDTLAVHCNFLKKCSDAEKNIGYTSSGQVEETPPLNTSVKMEDVDMDFEDVKHSIEIESLDIKDEEGQTESGVNKQEICSQSEACLGSSDVQMYKCATCNYKSRYKHSLKRHLLRHKDRSDVQMYKCEACAYETYNKSSLKLHLLIHKDPSQVQMYKCEHCDYESKNKQHLKNHMKRHTDTSKVQMYKCKMCDFESKHKHCLKNHGLVHKDPSEVPMYKCERCNYKTHLKYYLKKHNMLKHENLSQVHRYKCGICNYTSKDKGRFKTHNLLHGVPPELQLNKGNFIKTYSKTQKCTNVNITI